MNLALEDPYPDLIHVFGSNLGGYHGAGAAHFAHQVRGFPYRLGVGPSGRCYAIPTKDETIQTLDLHVIKLYVDQFLEYADLMLGADIQFQITRIGCGLAGYKDEDIAPMFMQAGDNCWFDTKWESIMERNNCMRTYWGTF